MATTITEHDLRTQSDAIMQRLEAGEAFVLTRDDRPVGELTPIRRRRFVRSEDLLAAWATLPPVDWRALRDDLDAIVDQDLTPRD